jgi:hypothetical protein
VDQRTGALKRGRQERSCRHRKTGHAGRNVLHDAAVQPAIGTTVFPDTEREFFPMAAQNRRMLQWAVCLVAMQEVDVGIFAMPPTDWRSPAINKRTGN